MPRVGMLSSAWRILANCYLTPSVLGHDRMDESDTESEPAEEPDYFVRPASVAVTPLDPIQPETVGRAGVRQMMSCNASQNRQGLNQVLAVVQPRGRAPLWARTLTTDAERPPWVHEDYIGHMEQLRGCGLIQAIPAKEVQMVRQFSGYFAVPKTEECSRAIFSGKALSERCPVPPTVNLISAGELIQLMRRHGAQNDGTFHVVTGDLRHWFHQISVPHWLRCLFGLKVQKTRQAYIWRSLPMGWSWSPVIAQACAWSFLAFRDNQETALIPDGAFSEHMGLPRWVATEAGHGFATVYYDNFLVVTAEKSQAVAWQARIDRNRLPTQAGGVNVEIKGTTGKSQLITAHEMESDGLDYLGILFRVDREARMLYVTPRKREAWLHEARRVRDRASVRDAAAWIGRAIFAALCSGRPIFRIDQGRTLLEMARVVGGLGRKGWDRACDASVWQQVRAACFSIIENADYALSLECGGPRQPLHSMNDWILTSDASCSHCGWIIYRMARHRLIREGPPGLEPTDLYFSGRWEAPEHIFLLEMRAAVGVLKKFRSVMPVGRATLVVDNAAVYYALQNGMTASRRGQEIMDTLQEHDLDDIDMVLVPSQQNPADCPSRDNTSDLAARQERLFLALLEHRKGKQLSPPDRKAFTGSWSGVRHTAAPDER